MRNWKLVSLWISWHRGEYPSHPTAVNRRIRLNWLAAIEKRKKTLACSLLSFRRCIHLSWTESSYLRFIYLRKLSVILFLCQQILWQDATCVHLYKLLLISNVAKGFLIINISKYNFPDFAYLRKASNIQLQVHSDMYARPKIFQKFKYYFVRSLFMCWYFPTWFLAELQENLTTVNVVP